MWSTNTLWFEVAVVSAIFAIGNIVFGHFEERTPKWRRITKYLLVTAVIVATSHYAGRSVAIGLLAVAFVFIIYVHGFVLPKKGINGLTGEPRDKYYEFRGWKK
jgi:hypothetical protein